MLYSYISSVCKFFDVVFELVRHETSVVVCQFRPEVCCDSQICIFSWEVSAVHPQMNGIALFIFLFSVISLNPSHSLPQPLLTSFLELFLHSHPSSERTHRERKKCNGVLSSSLRTIVPLIRKNGSPPSEF